jgi:hypothetical protein
MNHLMRTLISWSNLTKTRSTSGQIATLLILALILLLVFVLVTMNLGDVALKSTTISNAADAASLALASNLCTKAKMIFDGLGHKMAKCRSRGFLSMLLAIIAAVVLIVVSVMVPAMSWLAGFFITHLGDTLGMAVVGAIGGAVGGATGAAIQGTSVLQGAITGAAIGAAIGTLAAGIGQAVVWGEISAKTLAFGALGIASSIYNDARDYQGNSEILMQLQKDISKLDERSQFRENSFFIALTQVVDDPNKHADEDDINANGDRTELIPRFAWWWHRRMLEFAQIGAAQVAPVNDFIAATASFRDYIFNAYAGNGTTPGYLERQDYKWSLDNHGEETAYTGLNYGVVDGPIVALLRPLDNFHYSTPSWLPGPSADEMNTWLGEDCSGSGDCSSGTCTSTTCTPPPASYDGLDRVADDLRDMVQSIDGMIAPPSFEIWINHMLENVNVGFDVWSQPWLNDLRTQYDNTIANLNPSQNWQSWRSMFYNPDNPSDPTAYYNTLQTYINYLTNLENQLINIRDNELPVCNEGNYDATGTCTSCIPGAGQWQLWGGQQQFVNNCGGCVFNPPCSFRTSQNHPHDTGTIDTSGNDAFLPALAPIDDLINHLSAYRDRIKQFSDAMDSYMANLDSDLGGLNPVHYAWTDMRGYNEVWVQVGPFIMPQLKQYKTGNWLKGKVCNGLIHSTDENNCWVKVTKNSPSQNMGALGRWNPFNRGVNKISYAYFDGGRDDPQVGIRATR